MLFWTKEEYLKFIEAVKDKPYSYQAFQILYWCGLQSKRFNDKICIKKRIKKGAKLVGDKIMN